MLVSEHPEQLLVGAQQVGLVPGGEAGAAARRVLQPATVGGPAQCHHPGLGRQVHHGQPVEAPARGHGQPAHQERLVPDGERTEDVEAQRGSDEAGGSQGRRGPHVPEVEVVLDGVAQLAVEDPEHHRHARPAIAQEVPHGQPGLDVGEVVAGEDGHGRRRPDVGVFEGLSLGGVGDEHRRPERPGVVEVAVVLVPLDHHHLPALGLQSLQHPDAHRAEADHHHVALETDQLLAAEGLLDPPRNQHVGDEGEDRRQQRGAPGDQEDPEDLHGGGLVGEGEVPVAHRGDGLHGEVEGGERGHVTTAREPEGQPQDDGRQDDECGRGHDGEPEGAVVVRSQQRTEPGERAGPAAPPAGGGPPTVVPAPAGQEVGPLELLGRPEHRHPVADVDRRSRPGQATVGDPSAGTTAIGARAPKRARRVAKRTTSTSQVTKRVPASSIW